MNACGWYVHNGAQYCDDHLLQQIAEINISWLQANAPRSTNNITVNPWIYMVSDSETSDFRWNRFSHKHSVQIGCMVPEYQFWPRIKTYWWKIYKY